MMYVRQITMSLLLAAEVASLRMDGMDHYEYMQEMLKEEQQTQEERDRAFLDIHPDWERVDGFLRKRSLPPPSAAEKEARKKAQDEAAQQAGDRLAQWREENDSYTALGEHGQIELIKQEETDRTFLAQNPGWERRADGGLEKRRPPPLSPAEKKAQKEAQEAEAEAESAAVAVWKDDNPGCEHLLLQSVEEYAKAVKYGKELLEAEDLGHAHDLLQQVDVSADEMPGTAHAQPPVEEIGKYWRLNADGSIERGIPGGPLFRGPYRS